MQKIVNLNFYDVESNKEYYIKLFIENILFFRDTLVKKMKAIKIKVESMKIIKGQKQEIR